MRRQQSAAAALGLATLALPAANAAAALEHAAAPTKTARAKTTVVTRKVSGTPGQADRWGDVTIVLTVKKTTTVRAVGKRKVTHVTRKITDIGGTFTYHTDRSLYIMQQALPMLRQQALQTMSARNVQMISGATYTSEAFLSSFQNALLKARTV